MAEFWEYDARLMRRWNTDPLAHAGQSLYEAFYSNPIAFADPLGLKPGGPGDEDWTPGDSGPWGEKRPGSSSKPNEKNSDGSKDPPYKVRNVPIPSGEIWPTSIAGNPAYDEKQYYFFRANEKLYQAFPVKKDEQHQGAYTVRRIIDEDKKPGEGSYEWEYVIGSEVMDLILLGGRQVEEDLAPAGDVLKNIVTVFNMGAADYAWVDETGKIVGTDITTWRSDIIEEVLKPENIAANVLSLGILPKPRLYTVNPSKFDYFFGKVTSGPAHNIQRSAQNLKDLTKMGITNKSQLIVKFDQAIKSGSVISTKTSEYGTTVTKRIIVGSNGSIDVSFFYQGGNMSQTPSVTTIIPKTW